MEEARWSYFDERPEVARRINNRGAGHAVVNIHIDYRRGASIGEVLRIETRLSRVGNSDPKGT